MTSFRKEKIASITEGVLLFCLMKPYFLWTLFDNNYFKLFIVLISCLLFFFFTDRLEKKERVMMISYILIYILYVLTNINWVVVFSLLLFLVPFARESFYRKTFDSFYNVYCVVVGLGLVVWIIHLLGFLEPYATIEQNSDLRDNPFDVYPLVVCERDMFAIRFGACFDEPGVVGTMSVLLLMAKSFNVRDWRSWVVFISGVFSLSFFFFGILGFYLVYYSIFVKKNILFILLLSLLVVFAYLKTKDDPTMDYLVWQRFEFDKTEKKFSRDNRMTEYGEQYYEKIRWTSEYWFGVNDWMKFWNLAAGGSSYKIVVMRNGMVFYALYTLWFLLFAKQKIKRRKLFYLFCIMYLATVYQRTNLYDPVYTFLFIYIMRISFGGPRELADGVTNKKLKYESVVDNKY